MRSPVLAFALLFTALGAGAAVASQTCATPHPPVITINGTYPKCEEDRVKHGRCDLPNTNSSECIDRPPFMVTISTYDHDGIPPFLYCVVEQNFYVQVRRKQDGEPCGSV